MAKLLGHKFDGQSMIDAQSVWALEVLGEGGATVETWIDGGAVRISRMVVLPVNRGTDF